MKIKASIVPLVFVFTLIAGDDSKNSRVTQTPQWQFNRSRNLVFYSCRFNFKVQCLLRVNGYNINIADYGYTWMTGNGSNTNDCSIEAKSVHTPKLSDDRNRAMVECIGRGDGPRKVTIGDSIKLQCPATNQDKCSWTRKDVQITMNNRYSYGQHFDCSLRIKKILPIDLTDWNCYDSNSHQWSSAVYTLVELITTEQTTVYPTSYTPETTITSTTSAVTTSKTGATTRSTSKTYRTVTTDITDSTTSTSYIIATNSPPTIDTVAKYANTTTNSRNASSINSNDDQSMTLTVIVAVAVVVTCAIAFVMATIIYYLRRQKNLKDKRTAPDESKYSQISFNAKSEDILCPGSISESNYMTLSGPFAPPSQKPTSNRPPPRNVNNVDQSNDAIYADVIIDHRSPTASCPGEIPRNNVDDVTYADVIISPRSANASRPVDVPRNNVDDVTYADVIIGQRSPNASREVPHNVGDVTYAVVMPKRH